jgi:hypothetical protein
MELALATMQARIARAVAQHAPADTPGQAVGDITAAVIAEVRPDYTNLWGTCDRLTDVADSHVVALDTEKVRSEALLASLERAVRDDRGVLARARADRQLRIGLADLLRLPADMPHEALLAAVAARLDAAPVVVAA